MADIHFAAFLVVSFLGCEVLGYVAMACAITPGIHVVFSFFLGGNEYLPFPHVPSIGSLV